MPVHPLGEQLTSHRARHGRYAVQEGAERVWAAPRVATVAAAIGKLEERGQAGQLDGQLAQHLLVLLGAEPILGAVLAQQGAALVALHQHQAVDGPAWRGGKGGGAVVAVAAATHPATGPHPRNSHFLCHRVVRGWGRVGLAHGGGKAQGDAVQGDAHVLVPEVAADGALEGGVAAHVQQVDKRKDGVPARKVSGQADVWMCAKEHMTSSSWRASALT